MNTYAYIYKATNSINGKLYIGFTSMSIEKRWSFHKRDSKKSNTHLHNAIRKYGLENFKIEIIAMSPNTEYCKNVLEPYYIKQYNSYKNGYNMTLGGDGAIGYSHTEEAKEKLRISHVGKTHSEESKEKMRVVALEKKNFLGKKHSDKTKEKIRIANTGKILSDGHKEKIRIAHVGKIHSKEHNEKLSKVNSKKWKFMLNGETIEIFNLLNYCKENNLNRICMLNVHSGTQKSHKGYSKGY